MSSPDQEPTQEFQRAPLTAQLIRQREKIICEYDPINIIKMGYLRIKSKDQKLVNLEMNEVQKQIVDKIQAQRKKLKPVRLVVLKGRQFGISTLMEAIIYCFTTQRPNINSLIMSDDDDGSNYLFEMTKLYYEMLQIERPTLVPVQKKSNEKKLEFQNKRSQILIDTAKNVDAGRKYTFHMAHLSEAARFRNFEQSLLSLMQSVPDKPETYVFIETTANGENDFAKFWWKVKKEYEQGITDWVPIFLSWKDHSEYQRKFTTESERENFIRTMTSEEKLIQEQHQLTLEQMNWRRSTLINKCNSDLSKFRQEYPLTDDEAFVTSGKRVFPDIYTRPQEKNMQDPKYVGSVEMIEKRATFVPSEDGNLKIYKTPIKGHNYVIASDSSAAVSSGDPCCAQVIDRTTWEQVAVLSGYIPPDLFGDKLYALGAYYHWALLAPEVNVSGLVTTLRLRDLMYPRIVHRTKLNIDNVGNVTESEELGWHTNVKTKPVLVAGLSEALRELLVVLHDRDTLKEIKAYSILDVKDGGNVVYGGAGGHHDDRVMALAIAIYFAKQVPESTYQESFTEEVHSTRRSGY